MQERFEGINYPDKSDKKKKEQMVDTVKEAYEKGCAKKWDDFQRKLEERIDIEKKPVDSDQGLALKVGSLVFGDLLNRKPEDKACKISKRLLKSQDLNEIEKNLAENSRLAVALQLLGEELIGAAKKTLPGRVKILAGEWKNSNEKQQQEIIKQVYEIMQDEKLHKIDVSLENFSQMEDFQNKFNIGSEPAKYLPAMFDVPNCLGKVIQLSAFAKECGAKFYKLGIIKHAVDEDKKDRMVISAKIRKDINDRGLINDSMFEERLNVNEVWDEHFSLVDRWHVCIAMQLNSGSWMLLDSYGMVCGLLPENMQNRMTEIDTKFAKYGSVLPGVSLMVVDEKIRNEESKAEKFSGVHAKINRSIEVEKKLRLCRDLNDLEKVYFEDVIDDFLPDTQMEEYRVLIRMGIIDKKIVVKDLLAQGIERHGHSDLKKIVDEILTFYHYQALNDYDKQFLKKSENHDLMHQAFEVMNPEFSIGLAVVNSLSIENSLDLSEPMADFSNEQIYRLKRLFGTVGRWGDNFLETNMRLDKIEKRCWNSLKREDFRHQQVDNFFVITENILKMRKNLANIFKGVKNDELK